MQSHALLLTSRVTLTPPALKHSGHFKHFAEFIKQLAILEKWCVSEILYDIS